MKAKNKIEKAYALYLRGRELPGKKRSVEDIAKELGIAKPSTVRGYVYRMKHPEVYAECVKNYFARLRAARGKERTAEQKAAADKKKAEEQRLSKSPKVKAALKHSQKTERKMKAVSEASGKRAAGIVAQVHAESAAIIAKAQKSAARKK